MCCKLTSAMPLAALRSRGADGYKTRRQANAKPQAAESSILPVRDRSLRHRNLRQFASFPVRRRPLFTQRLDNRLEIGNALQHHQPLMHVLAGPQHARIPAAALAEGQAGVAFAALLDEQLVVPGHEIEPL